MESKPHYHPLFDDPTCDTILRAREGTLFRVPGFVLRRTTGHFAATLQPPVARHAALHDEFIALDVSAGLLACMLALLCGLPPPLKTEDTTDDGKGIRSMDDAQTLTDLLDLARLWSAPGVIARLRPFASASRCLRAQPLLLYALAVCAGWECEAAEAARHTLALDLYSDTFSHAPGRNENGEVLKRLPASALLRLLHLHRRRRDVLDRLISGDAEGDGGVKRGDVCGRCKGCGTQADNYLWKEYRTRIFMEMDKRPLGDTIVGFAVEEWREALACWSAKCSALNCGRLLYERDVILPQIQACIDQLPFTL